MGSDMYMNPPEKVWHWREKVEAEEAFDLVHSWMGDLKEFRVEPTGENERGELTWRIGVWLGEWN